MAGGRVEVRLCRRGGRGDALGARGRNRSITGGRGRLLKVQGTRVEEALLLTK